MKNKYNPFKMWGSWAGLAIFSIFRLILTPITIEFNPIRFIVNYELGFPFIFSAIISIIWLSIGFLIGWGINSLYRKFK